MKYFEQVFDALEFIESQIEQEIDVGSVTRRSGLSSWHFQRIFRDAVGESIGSYLRRRRLAASLDMLQNPASKVIDIAVQFQFNSSEAYSRAFKEEFGFSPQHYRQQRPKIIPYRKPILTRSQFEYVANEIEFTPEIRMVDEILLAGLPVVFPSALSKRHEYMTSVQKVWKEFVRRENELSHKIGAIKVGYLQGLSSPLHHIHDDMMEYVACTPVSSLAALPNDFRGLSIPSGKYAVFKATGFHEQTQYMIDHIYSTWLPNTDFLRAEGAEFTWLDHRVMPLDPLKSEVEYFLPIL